MRKGAVFLIFLFVIIGVWKFISKVVESTDNQLFYGVETKLVGRENINHGHKEVTERGVMPMHVIYNYLPDSKKGTIVKHKYYTLSYNEKYEQAEWVAYKLNGAFMTGTAKRASSFYNDKGVLTGSAHKNDYKHSGYDRGHLLPAGDMKRSKEAMKETFYMSNITPQVPGLNRKAWKYLEAKIRDKSKIYDSLYIITGPIVKGEHEKIGDNEVAVPFAFYKIILNYSNTANLCAIAFIFPNKEVCKLTNDYIVDIDSVEVVTGHDFFSHLPVEVQEKFENNHCLQLLD